MSTFAALQRKKHDTLVPAAPNYPSLRPSRPFVSQFTPTPEPVAPGTRSQLEQAAHFGYSFERISLLPPEQKNTVGLPNTLRAGIENLSGISMDDVHVHYHSPKPAHLQALAYAQGTSIHIGPGQEKHLAHEAWHVVQQKQGRVKPTWQAKGMAINDAEVLETEADVMGANALKMGYTNQGVIGSEQQADAQKKRADYNDIIPCHRVLDNSSMYGAQQIVQRTKGTLKAEKGAKGMLVGAGIGAAIGSVLPGIGTVIGATIGASIGTLAGAYRADYPVFRNAQAAQYNNELQTYRQWKEAIRKIQHVQNIYQRGEFVRYSSANEKDFHLLLNLGQVMYAYDVRKKLTISGHLAHIKHALLAEGADVYAAGTAQLAGEEASELFERVNMVDNYWTNRLRAEQYEEQAWSILDRAGKKYKDIDSMIKKAEIGKEEKEILKAYRDFAEVAEHWYQQLEAAKIDPDKTFDETIPKDEAQVSLTEDSGHYHPGYEAGHAAFEGWRGAGYNKLTWDPRWNRGEKHQVSVS